MSRGRPLLWASGERQTLTHNPTGVVATAWLHTEIERNTGDPKRWSQDQLDAREGLAGPLGESERPIVPSKPGNAGGGKGPQFQVNGGSGESRRVAQAYYLHTGSEVMGTVARLSEEWRKPSWATACVLVREPDAANPQVRFDEGEVETETWEDIRAPATERAGNMQGFPTTTAPPPYSTWILFGSSRLEFSMSRFP
jgi:hypothetical protein